MTPSKVGESSSSSIKTKGKEDIKSKVKVKAGSNWKKLHKTLSNSSLNNGKKNKGRLSANGTLKRPENIRHETIKTSDSDSRTSSPAPTSLPWFAEDLSPEDLALVRTNSIPNDNGNTNKTLSENKGSNEINANGDLSKDEQEERRIRTILGGEGLSKGKAEPGAYVAMDCEMVGVGPNGSESVLARCSIVNWHGATLLDTFVRPQEKVTDYRTWVSGVRAKDLQNAPLFAEVQEQVAKLIKGRILVGHALHNDLHALLLSHPKHMTRDTASYAGSRKLANTKYPSLRKLVELRLGFEIQKSGTAHSSVEDARATMAVYRTFHAEWQQALNAQGKGSRKRTSSTSSTTQIIGKGWKKGRTSEQGSGDVARVAPNSKPRSSKNGSDDPEWWKKL